MALGRHIKVVAIRYECFTVGKAHSYKIGVLHSLFTLTISNVGKAGIMLMPEQLQPIYHMYDITDLTTLEGFTTMVTNEGLEKAEPIEPGPPGPTALHPLRRMRCELFHVKHLQEHTYSFLRVELSQLLGERESPLAMVRFEPATFRLAVECFNHSATSQYERRDACCYSYQLVWQIAKSYPLCFTVSWRRLYCYVPLRDSKITNGVIFCDAKNSLYSWLIHRQARLVCIFF